MTRPGPSPFDPEAQHERPAAKIVAAIERLGQATRVLLWQSAQAAGLELSSVQVQTLVFLRFHDASMARVSRLAAEFMLTPATVSDAVSALERKGYVEKRPAADDRRARVLHLTTEGQRAVAAVLDWAEPLHESVTRLSDADQAAMMRLLFDVIAGLQERGIVETTRMCLTCRHFQAADTERITAHCRLLDRPLPDRSLRFDCPEHAPAAALG